MLSRWQKVKYVSIGGFVITWITFFGWLNLTSESSNSLSEATVEPVQKTCIDYRNQKDESDFSFDAKVNEGEALIAKEFKESMLSVLGLGYLSKTDEVLVKNYLSFSIVNNENSSKSYNFSNYLNDRFEFERIVQNLLSRGLISLEYSPRVQAIGLEVNQLYAASKELVSSHPQCFKLEVEIDELIESVTADSKSISGVLGKSEGWIRARSVSELVDSLVWFVAPVPPKS